MNTRRPGNSAGGSRNAATDEHLVVGATLQDIVNSAGISLIALDPDLILRFYTPAALSFFELSESSIGKPLFRLPLRFADDQLLLDAEAVLTTRLSMQRQIQSAERRYYDRKVMPIQGRADMIRGVVISFSDISEIRAAKQDIEAARAYASSIVDAIRQPLVVLDHTLRIISASPAFYSGFQVAPGEVVGQTLNEFHQSCLDGEPLRRFLGQVAGQNDLVDNCEITATVSADGPRVFLLSAHRIPVLATNARSTLLVIEDITERKNAELAVNAAKRVAEQANLGKSRFLAAASHDLRQPLQTMSLLQDLLAVKIRDPETSKLIGKFRESLDVMSGILNKLLDITQLEAGVVRPEMEAFPLRQLFERFRDELTFHGDGKEITCRVVPSSLWVSTDPTLLDQMIRNLVANALKYTNSGKVLLGCRRRGNMVRIEVWDTGPGIPREQLQAIFEEFHQLNNAARERSRGFGLGLSIVQRLGDLLGHSIEVKSKLGQGSVFSIEVPFADPKTSPKAETTERRSARRADSRDLILIVEDEETIGEALEMVFANEGYQTVRAIDGESAISTIARRALRPAIVVTDFNLPNEMSGLAVASAMRARLGNALPVIIVTGDISADTASAISRSGCMQLNKPVKADELLRAVRLGLVESRKRQDKIEALAKPTPIVGGPCIYIIDDNSALREALGDLLTAQGMAFETFENAEAYLEDHGDLRSGCLIVDAQLPGMSGIALMQRLQAEHSTIPAIMITGYGDINTAVSAMKAGAIDFMEKPIAPVALLAAINRALEMTRTEGAIADWRNDASRRIQTLTPREHQIMNLIISGRPNKIIASDLSISQRTVENHRAAIFRKTKSKSLSDLVRLSIAAA